MNLIKTYIYINRRIYLYWVRGLKLDVSSLHSDLIAKWNGRVLHVIWEAGRSCELSWRRIGGISWPWSLFSAGPIFVALSSFLNPPGLVLFAHDLDMIEGDWVTRQIDVFLDRRAGVVAISMFLEPLA